MLVYICVLSWPTLTAHGCRASWVKHPALVTCCWNWPGPRRITKETDHTSAPSGWKESVREARNVPTGEQRSVFFFIYFFKLFQRSRLVYKNVFFSLYRHEKPTDPDDPLADQNIKDRYYGVNDPVADKLLKRASTMPRLDPPDDKSISTLYIGGLGDTITDGDLK